MYINSMVLFMEGNMSRTIVNLAIKKTKTQRPGTPK